MGRYAYFSTGYEYKFAFALQESSDILEFGGWHSLKDISINKKTGDIYEELGKVRWDIEDINFIKFKLELFKLPLFDITTYEKNMDGLYNFRNDLSDKLLNDKMSDKSDESDEEQSKIYKYILGYLIYFQLHMKPTLSVEFEY